jgi:hypothetical protein
MSDISKQLQEYRLRHKRKLNDDTIMTKFVSKYSNLIELNKEKRSSSRIVNFVKKRLLIKINNNFDHNCDPNLTHRIKLFDYNLIPNYNDNNKSDIKDNDLMNMFNSTGDYQVDIAILESLKDTYQSSVKKKDQPKHIANIFIDLQIYGQCPYLEIFYDNHKYYLTQTQQQRVNKIWNRINTDTEAGKRFQLIIESSKALVEAYNKAD